MLFKQISVIKYACCVCHVRNRIGAVLRDKLQLFVNIQIRLLDILQPFIIGNVHEKIGIQEIGIVNIPADSDNIRIILPDKTGFQNRYRIVGRINSQFNIIVGFVEFFLQLFKYFDCFLLVLDHFDNHFSVVSLTAAASQRSG